VIVLLSSVVAQGLTIASAKQVIALEPLQIALSVTAAAAVVRARTGLPLPVLRDGAGGGPEPALSQR
jgi:hypothetical protein